MDSKRSLRRKWTDNTHIALDLCFVGDQFESCLGHFSFGLRFFIVSF
jgi:hypothetical protein